MATIIKIKRTTGATAPSGLNQGELAYVYDTSATNAGAGGNGYRLFIGDPTSTSNAAIEIGGRYYTQLLDHTPGTLTASSSIITDSNNAIDDLYVGNNATTGGSIKFNEGTNNGSNYIALKSPNSVTANVTYTLPSTYSSGQFLTIDGSGNMSFAAVPSGSFTISDGTNTDTFTTGQTLTFTGGTGIDTTVTNNEITYAIDSTVATASSTHTFTNKTFDANGTGNSLSNVEVADFAGSAIVTEAEGIGSNDNDTTLPTSAAVKDYVDNTVTAQDLDFQGDSGGALSIDLDSETLTIAGGTGINTSGATNTLTVAIDSTVATLTGSQTLTNKTVNLTNNTLTGTTAEFNAALSDGDFATLAGIETLTNKTLTSPDINGGSFDGGTIGTGSAVTVAQIDNLNINGNTISSTDVNGDLILDPNGSGDVDVNSSKIINVATPTASTDAANKGYVDGVVNGLDVKESVSAATTANLSATYNNAAGTLTAGSNGALSIDGVTPSQGDRVLVKDQTTQTQNGIYTVTTVGDATTAFVLTRAPDADTASELTGGTFFFVEQGTANADNGYVATHNGTPTFGTTNITFSQFSGAGQITAGDGLTKSGNTLNVVGTVNRITANANTIDIAATYIGQTSITTLGTIATGTWNATEIGEVYGGTGQTSYTTGDILYASASNTLAKLSLGADGKILQSNGTNVEYGDLDGGTY